MRAANGRCPAPDIDPVHGALHHHPEPNIQTTVHGADPPGFVAQITGAPAGAGFNILDLNSDVGGSSDRPICFMIIDGVAAGAVAAVERVLEPLRRDGIGAHVTGLVSLIG